MSDKRASVTFGAACAVNDEIIYVASFIDDMPSDISYTRMFVLNIGMNDKWFYHDIPDETVVSVTYDPNGTDGKRICYSLSDTGFIEAYNSGGAILTK